MKTFLALTTFICLMSSSQAELLQGRIASQSPPTPDVYTTQSTTIEWDMWSKEYHRRLLNAAYQIDPITQNKWTLPAIEIDVDRDQRVSRVVVLTSHNARATNAVYKAILITVPPVFPNGSRLEGVTARFGTTQNLTKEPSLREQY